MPNLCLFTSIIDVLSAIISVSIRMWKTYLGLTNQSFFWLPHISNKVCSANSVTVVCLGKVSFRKLGKNIASIADMCEGGKRRLRQKVKKKKR